MSGTDAVLQDYRHGLEGKTCNEHDRVITSTVRNITKNHQPIPSADTDMNQCAILYGNGVPL